VTDVATSATWMGSGLLLIPLIVVVGGYVLVRHHDWRPIATLAVGFGGVTALYYLVKALVDRSRPPASMRVGPPFASGSFPSGHSAEALVVWGLLAVLAASIMVRHRWLPVLGAALVVLMVGAVRVYLGTHWPSDVLSGYALGGAWLGLVAAVTQGLSTGRPRRATEAGRAARASGER
jgi:undecaprenyl-diphosphatase